MLEATFKDVSIFKNVINLMKDTVTSASFDCSEHCITVQEMDDSHVALVSLNLPMNFFQEYRCSQTPSLGLNLDDISKALMDVNEGNVCTLEYKNERAAFTYYDAVNTIPKKQTFLELLDVDEEQLGIPDQKYSASFEMNTAEFANTCQEISKYSDSVTISAVKNGVTFEGNGTTGSYVVTYGAEANAALKSLLSYLYKKTVTSIFSVKYLINFAKASKHFDRVRLSFSEGVPLVIEYKICEGSGYLRYYLAPKYADIEKKPRRTTRSTSNLDSLGSSAPTNPGRKRTTERRVLESKENSSTPAKLPRKSTANITTTSSTPLNSETQPPQVQPPHTCKWHEMIKDNQYFDVILVASDITKISSHRFLLSKYSTTFTNIFKESQELPVRIEMKEFTAETILAALDFMMDKFDSINGKEFAVLKFAARYNIPDLMEACSKTVEISLNNVCEVIEIAYSHYHEDLKKKCLKFIVQNKNDIEAAKFNGLPKNILIDVIRF